MKLNVIAASIVLAGLLITVGASIVHADGYKGWSPIKTTGYAVISNYQGIDAPLYQDVVVTAGTTDMSITNIVFRWHDPNDNKVWEDNVLVSGPLTTPTVPSNVHQEVIDWANANTGVKYLYAQSTHAPNIIGDWGVQAFFIGPGGKEKAGLQNVIKIRSTSFNVIPEVPIIGTAGAAITMLLGFGFFGIRRKRVQ
jgi:hypothetical protein